MAAGESVEEKERGLAEHAEEQQPPRASGHPSVDLGHSVDARQEAHRDAQDQEQREPVNLEIAQDRLVGGDLPQQRVAVGGAHGRDRVPDAEDGLRQEEAERGADEAEVRLRGARGFRAS